MNSPNSGNGEKDSTARQWRVGRARPAEPFDSPSAALGASANKGRLARRPLLHHLQHARDAFAKNGWFGDQAQHEMAFIWKIVKVAWMDAHTRLAQQADGKIFVTLDGGDTDDNVPS